MSFKSIQDISEKIYKDQASQIDNHLFNWLAEQGFSVPRNKEAAERFLKEKNYELICKNQQTEHGRIVTYKLAKIITLTKILVKNPVITIDGENITI